MNKKTLLIGLMLLVGLPLAAVYGLAPKTTYAAPVLMTAQATEAAQSAPAPAETPQPAPVAPEAAAPATAPQAKPAPMEEPKAQAAPRGEPHADYARMQIKECTNCHRGMGVTPNHGADWSKEHRVMAEKSGNNCADCHQQSFCLDCHVGGGIEPDLSKSVSRRGDYMPRSHLADFISLHPIKALDSPQNCYRCHDASYCYDCHSRLKSNTLNIKSHVKTFVGQDFIWNSEHSREARRNLQSCQTCHPEGDVCLQCHSAKLSVRVNPHPKNWDGSKLKSKSGDRTCRLCH